MTTILGKFSKQSAEVLDYDVDFTKWFAKRSLTPLSFTVEADAGITVVASSRINGVVKIVLGGGTDGVRYKITVRMASDSTPTLVREADFTVSIKNV